MCEVRGVSATKSGVMETQLEVLVTDKIISIHNDFLYTWLPI
jgi:hypothetical protein